MMSSIFPRAFLAACLSVPGIAVHAGDFAPVGSKALLTVDYIYESAGKRRSEGLYDPYEWKVRRSVNMQVDLAAQATAAMPQLQTFEAGQTAEMNRKAEKSQVLAKQTAPMLASAGNIAEKCGDDEACITREAMKMAAAMQGSGQIETVQNAAKQGIALGTPGAPRYQVWHPKREKASYLIDETVHVSVTDPICAGKPRIRCTRDETRKGSGEVPPLPDAKNNPQAAAGIAAVEVDLGKNTITIRGPVPFMLPYTETIVTDEPEGTHDTPTPKGPVKKQLAFALNSNGGINSDKPFPVPLKGGWRSQSGEQYINIKGEFGNGGKLTMRWRFVVQ